MNTKTTKGSWRRPIINKMLAELGEEIWREKDEDKRDFLIKKWHELKWEQAKQQRPDLWGEE